MQQNSIKLFIGELRMTASVHRMYAKNCFSLLRQTIAETTYKEKKYILCLKNCALQAFRLSLL